MKKGRGGRKRKRSSKGAIKQNRKTQEPNMLPTFRELMALHPLISFPASNISSHHSLSFLLNNLAMTLNFLNTFASLR